MSLQNATLAAFDLGGVLLAPKTGSWYLTEPVEQFLRGLGQGSKDIEGAVSFAKECTAHRIFAKALDDEQAIYHEFYKNFFAHLCPEEPVSEQQIGAFSKYRVHSHEQYLWDLQAIETIRTLSGFIDTALFSNTWPSIVAALRRGKILDAFSYAFLSCDAGMKKPDPRFFATLSEQTHRCPGEIVLYDDSPQNIRMALSLGFQARTVSFGSLSSIVSEDFREEQQC